MRVLFCTDGSAISYNSIINMSKWAKKLETDVLCVADWNFIPDFILVEDAEFALKCVSSVKSILTAAEKYLTENGIKVRKAINMCGGVVDSILEISENNDYDAIILGSNGKKGLQKWLGSVSQDILTSSKNSNYIAKKLNNANKILIATDYSNISKIVIDKIIEVFNLEDKEIYLVNVYESPDYLFLEGNIDAAWIRDTNKKQEDSANRLLNDLCEKFSANNINVRHKIVLSGNPAEEIIKLTNREHIDLVVCGMRNHRNIAKFLISSVSKRVLENSESDVFIIKPNSY